jgi:hypothetical protein
MTDRACDVANLSVVGALDALGTLENDARVAALCVLAHSLTVDARAILVDRPLSDTSLDRLQRINEFLHQLTGYLNPSKRRPARPDEDVELVRAIADSSERYGLELALHRALVTALRHAVAFQKRNQATGESRP